jgi:hypothetical protein
MFARSVSHVQVLFAMVGRVFVQTDDAMRRTSRAGRSNCGLTPLRCALPASPWWDVAATDKLGTVLSAALFGTISRNHICSVRNAVTVGTVDLVVHLDCLYVLCPLAQLVRPWRNWLTIRHRAVHFQTFEGSASSPPLVGICHPPT